MSRIEYYSAPGTRDLSSGLSPTSAGLAPGQRRSIAFSNGPPKIRMTKTRATPKTTICHSAIAQAAPRHAVTHTQAAVVRPCTRWLPPSLTMTPAPRKADAGDDPLDDAACVGAGHRVDR